MKTKRQPFSHQARLNAISRFRASYGVTYVRTLNGQIWREENLLHARHLFAARR